MNEKEKLLFARNELEIVINNLQNTLELSEMDIMLVIELILSTARYKSVMRNIYNDIKPKKKEKESEDGNSNETRQ